MAIAYENDSLAKPKRIIMNAGVEPARNAAMLSTGKAVKVSLYLSDGAKHHGMPVYASILDYLFHSGIAGATVIKGVAGFGAAHCMHSAHILEISDQLPIKIEFIETREKVDEVLPELEKRAGSCLIEVAETTIIVPAKN
jgi:PII-like signaling protein